MKQRFLSTTIISFILFSFVTSCKKDDTHAPAPLSATQAKNLVADAALTGNHYAFYSLERAEAVPFTDSATTKWDIAFRGTNIITNSGTSGPGAGGAFVQRSAAFDTYNTIAADSTFKTDAGAALAIRTGSGNGWYNYNSATNIISPIPGNIIVVRTASGKYAKLEVLSYYKDAPATPTAADLPRHYTFRFVFQTNGSKTF